MYDCDDAMTRTEPRGFRIFRFIGIGIMGVILAVLLGLGLGLLVQWLWNILAVPLFKLPMISYWQAVGLFVLAKLFFGGTCHGRGHHGHGYHGFGHGRPWRHHGRNFREFWESEGHQAFEKYQERMKNQPNA